MTLRRRFSNNILCSLLTVFMFGNFSLLFEVFRVNETVKNTGLHLKNKHSANILTIESYPLDVNLSYLVNEVLLSGKLTDYTTINHHPFEYVHRPLPCLFPYNRNNTRSILVLVKSHVLNVNQRLAIRHMWKFARDQQVRIVFLLGMYGLEGEQWRVHKESQLYSDILQESFQDNMDHVTYKTIMGFNWAAEVCSEANLYLFLDDDYYVKPAEMLQYLRKLPRKSNIFIGKVLNRQRNEQIKRNPKFKHYPPYDVPTYVNGGAFVISKDVVQKFKLAFPYVMYMNLDDVYLGFVADKLNLSPQHDSHFDTSTADSLAYECSHVAQRLLQKDCRLAGRRRDHPVIPRVVEHEEDTFISRFKKLPKIVKSAAKQTLNLIVRR